MAKNTKYHTASTSDPDNTTCADAKVADKYGLTEAQLTRIQTRLYDLDLDEHIEGFADQLSGPCLTGLIICFGSWEIIHQPKKIASEGIRKLNSASYLSSKSLQELAETLHEWDYIDCPHEWQKQINLSL